MFLDPQTVFVISISHGLLMQHYPDAGSYKIETRQGSSAERERLQFTFWESDFTDKDFKVGWER